MALYPPPGAPSPYWLQRLGFDIDQAYNPAHKTAKSCALVPGQKTVSLIFWGQSQTTNMVATGSMGTPSPFTPSSPLAHNFDPTSGAMWSGNDPMMGCSLGIGLTGRRVSGGSWPPRLADKLIADTAIDRVIFSSVGIGGVSIQNWVPPGQPFSVGDVGRCWERLPVLIRRLTEAGLAPSRDGAAAGTVATAFIVQIGETDANNASWIGLSASWAAAALAVVTAVRALGVPADVPWFFIKSTHPFTTAKTDIRAAIDLLNNPANNTYYLCDADTLTGTEPAGGANRQYDGIHFNPTGAAALAELAKTALIAYGAPFV